MGSNKFETKHFDTSNGLFIFSTMKVEGLAAETYHSVESLLNTN